MGLRILLVIFAAIVLAAIVLIVVPVTVEPAVLAALVVDIQLLILPITARIVLIGVSIFRHARHLPYHIAYGKRFSFSAQPSFSCVLPT